MNLKNFKVVHESQDKYRVAHPSGKEFEVEKSKLSGAAKRVIQKLCSGGVAKMSAGGDVGYQITPPASSPWDTSKIYPDTGRPADSPGEVMDSYIGAPIRAGIGEAQKGNFSNIPSAMYGTAGNDPRSAPNGVDLAYNSGVRNPYLGSAMATAVDFGSNLPAAEMMGGVGGPAGIIKGVEESGNLADASKLFKQRGSIPSSGEASAEIKSLSNEDRPEVKQFDPKGNLDSVAARGYVDKKQIPLTQNEHFGPYLTPDDVEQITGKRSPMSIPNYSAKPTGQIGTGAPTSFFEDPFNWYDSKFQASKQLLAKNKAAGMPVDIHTASDLIGCDDYMSHIPKGSTINLYPFDGPPEIARIARPGTASNLRIEKAAQRLKENGFKVNLIPTRQSALSDSGNMNFGGGSELVNQYQNMAPNVKASPFYGHEPIDNQNINSQGANVIPHKFYGGGGVQGLWGGGSSVMDNIPDQVELSDDQKAALPPSSSIASMINDSGPIQQGSSVAPSAQPAPTAAPVTPAQAAPNPIAQKSTDMNSILDQQEQGIKGYQGQLDKLGGQQQAAYQDLIDKQSQMQTPDEVAQQYKAKDDALLQHYMDSKVDPNRYLHNQSTGSKIISAIGLLLGGAGAGRGDNPVMQTIQNSINQDIQSQQNDQSKSMNLYRLNRDQMHDDMQAHLATQNQMLTGVQAKIAMTGAATQNLDARMRMQQTMTEIEQQKAQNRYRMGIMSGGGSGQVDPLMLASDPTIVPEAHQKQVITELGQAKTANKNKDNILKLFDQAAQDTRPATGMSATSAMNMIPGYEPPSIKNLKVSTDPLFKDNEGRYNKDEAADLHINFPQAFDSDDTVAKKRKAVENWVDFKRSAPTATAFGLNPDRFASTSSNPVMRLNSEQQRIYSIAKAHPNLPESALALKKLGVQ